MPPQPSLGGVKVVVSGMDGKEVMTNGVRVLVATGAVDCDIVIQAEP
jgi:hypothetical protein